MPLSAKHIGTFVLRLSEKLRCLERNSIQDKGEHIKFDKQTVLFGILNSRGNKTTFANWLIINVKYYICKQNAKKRRRNLASMLC